MKDMTGSCVFFGSRSPAPVYNIMFPKVGEIDLMLAHTGGHHKEKLKPEYFLSFFVSSAGSPEALTDFFSHRNRVSVGIKLLSG